MIRQAVAIGSWMVLAAVSLLPEKLRPQTRSVDAGLTAAAFFFAAAVTRFWLQETLTREQILAFVSAAIALAALRSLIGGRAFPVASMIAGASGAIAGALLVKFGLEGLPF